MELAAFFEFLTTRWQWLAAGFALLAVLAGGLGLLTRALGQKRGDRPLRREKAQARADAPQQEARPGGEAKAEEPAHPPAAAEPPPEAQPHEAPAPQTEAKGQARPPAQDP